MDLSNNKIPFGMLTEEEQEHMRHWPHGVEMYCADDAWDYCRPAAWVKSLTYRTKPAPKPVTRVEWFNDYGDETEHAGWRSIWYSSREDADKKGQLVKNRLAVHRIGVIRREWTVGQPPKYFTEEV